ncbi:MAG: hypothetical protein PWQ77_290 [Kosmotogales bacterium]|nr:hypothetical protein [Kosmotogales bacterium]
MDDFGNYLIDKIEKKNFKAYFVGGTVRDNILKRKTTDIDITSSANINQLIDIFENEKYYFIGKRKITLTFFKKNKKYEITPFRKDTETLKDDLLDRDLTINSIAYRKSVYYDYSNGIKDLNERTVKYNTNSKKIILEDPLRLLRAIRIALQLDFFIDDRTYWNIKKFASHIVEVAKERIQNEFTKIIVYGNDGINMLFRTNLLGNISPIFDEFHDEEYILKYEKCSLISGLFLIYKVFGINLYDYLDFLNSLSFPKKTIFKIKEIILLSNSFIDADKRTLKKLLNKFGKETVFEYINILKSLGGTVIDRCELDQIEKLLFEIISNDECYSLSDLKIDGRDIKNLGFSEGETIGYILKEILKIIIDNPDLNDKNTLLSIVEHYRTKSDDWGS